MDTLNTREHNRESLVREGEKVVVFKRSKNAADDPFDMVRTMEFTADLKEGESMLMREHATKIPMHTSRVAKVTRDNNIVRAETQNTVYEMKFPLEPEKADIDYTLKSLLAWTGEKVQKVLRGGW